MGKASSLSPLRRLGAPYSPHLRVLQRDFSECGVCGQRMQLKSNGNNNSNREVSAHGNATYNTTATASTGSSE